MRGAFWAASPPIRIASSISSTGASAMASSESKVDIRLSNARSELRSEVCWERIVSTSSGAASYLGVHSHGP